MKKEDLVYKFKLLEDMESFIQEKSCVEAYSTQIMGILQGTIIQILEDDREEPILFALLTQNKYSIFLKPFTSTSESFLEDIFEIINNYDMEYPFYFFKYDEILLAKYHKKYPRVGLKNWYFSQGKKVLEKYDTLQSMFGYISNEHYQNGLYNTSWYQEFGQDVNYGYKIVKFVEGNLFNKLTLVINHFSTMKENSKTPYITGYCPVATPEIVAVVDLETNGLTKESTVVSYGVLSGHEHKVFFIEEQDKKQFKIDMTDFCSQYETILAYNVDFEAKFFPENYVKEIRPLKLFKYTARRKVVYLPDDLDPGKGANVPIWYKMYQKNNDVSKRNLWKRLICLHNRADLLGQLAIYAIEKVPYQEKFRKGNLKLSRPKTVLTGQTSVQLLTERPEYYPVKNLDTYTYLDGKYSTYYKDQSVIKFNTDEIDDNIKNILEESEIELKFYYELDKTYPSLTEEILSLNIFSQEIIKVLENRGIKELYFYQYITASQINLNRSVIITAPTGNGKTEAFILPILQKIINAKDEIPGIKCIIFFPTKALGGDQFDKILELSHELGIKIGKIDGDVNQEERKLIFKSEIDILITTPDLIHYSLYKKEFQEFIRNTKIIVFDEIHVYEGVFFTHIFYLLRRMEKILEIRKDLQYIGASATIKNPVEFAETLFNKEVKHVDCKNPKSAKYELYGIGNNKSRNIVDLVLKLVQQNEKIIIFRNSQQQCEKTYHNLKKHLKDRIGMHRGGLDKERRSSVERNLKENRLDVVVCTASLELGIDIGSLTTVITPIVPINRLIQRIGRAGRGTQKAKVFIELKNDLVSEFYTKQPIHYIQDISSVSFQVENEEIKTHHLELGKLETGKDTKNAKEQLFSLRSIGNPMKIEAYNRIIGSKELPRAFYEFYPYSYITWNGTKFVVKNVVLDQSKKVYKAYLEKDYLESYKGVFIRPNIEMTLQTRKNDLIDDLPEYLNYALEYKQCRVTLTFKGIAKTENYQRENILLPEYSYSYKSKAVIIDVSEYVDEWSRLEREKRVELGTIKHTLSHLLLNASKMVIHAGNDLELVEKVQIYNKIVYIDTNESNGLCLLFIKDIKKIFERAIDLVNECGCTGMSGCVNCTYLYQCKNENLDTSLVIKHFSPK